VSDYATFNRLPDIDCLADGLISSIVVVLARATPGHRLQLDDADDPIFNHYHQIPALIPAEEPSDRTLLHIHEMSRDARVNETTHQEDLELVKMPATGHLRPQPGVQDALRF